MPLTNGTANRRTAGFSVLEIIIALMIIFVITAAYVTSVRWARDRAKFASLMADAHSIKIAIQRFQQDVGVFPPDVARGIDPGLFDKYGWRNGGHSADWDEIDLANWKGPYLEYWPKTPWGGDYDWDNYASGSGGLGMPGGAVYVVLKPEGWAGSNGLPSREYEITLEQSGIDSSPWPYCVGIRLATNGETAATR